MLCGFHCWIIKPLVLLGAWLITFSAVLHICTFLYLVSNALGSVCTRLSFTQPACEFQHFICQFEALYLRAVVWKVLFRKRRVEIRWAVNPKPSAVVVVPAEDAIKP